MFKHIITTLAFATPLAEAEPRDWAHVNPGIYLSTDLLDNFVRMGEAVGDYEPLVFERFFEPANACTVDKELSLIEQLQQCKKQRLGWLKI
tara:strand:+ start:948 stop:1220 length:273 start_codon:yes stop_codon:yes gene_type:complete